MDSKTQPPTAYDTTEDLSAPPPSYSESLPTYATASSSTSQYYSTQIQSQLQTLNHQIHTTLAQASALSQAQDEKVLSLLTYHIQSYLTSFSTSGLYKGTLILIPLAAFSDTKALPADYDFKDLEEFDSVVRVSDKDGSGRETWFWEDEELAKRLANELNPKVEPKNLPLPPRREEIQEAKSSPSSSKSSFWSRKKSAPKVVQPVTPVETGHSSKYPKDVKGVEVDGGDRVIMEVKAEEIDFRTENDFGLYGTERGWGIVVRLKVIMSRI